MLKTSKFSPQIRERAVRMVQEHLGAYGTGRTDPPQRPGQPVRVDPIDRESREAGELATLQWLHWFNYQRLMGPLGYIASA